MSAQRLILLALAALLIAAPASATLKVVSTTSVLWDPIRHIGGEKVEAIYLADPALCPHMQPDVINNRIQLQREFIRDADLFVAHNGTVDQTYVMPFVEKFMDANRYGEIAWVTPEDPAAIWNTPADARDLVTEVKGWLVAADPANEAYYEERYLSYIALINATEPDEEERDLIGGQDVIVMYWQKDAAEQWLGLNVVGFFAPEFVLAGQHTPAKVVDDINRNPDRYANVRYVIENMQSGELAKGVEEALNDRGIPAERVVFTNFPKSVAGVESIPDVLSYNKGLVTPDPDAGDAPAQTPLSIAGPVAGLAAGILLASRRS